MATFNVGLKPSKCSFGMQSIESLGHIFDKKGVYSVIQGFKVSGPARANVGKGLEVSLVW